MLGEAMSRKDSPLVSIITPSLNSGQFIEETILSVKNQDYPRIEHIIVDGGSVDNTLTVLKKYEGTYNMRWISEPDNGMYQAINKGMRMAKGEILGYLNADDLYLPWAIQVVVDSFNNNPCAHVVYGDLIHMAMNDQHALVLFLPPEYLLKLHLRVCSLAQPAVFWRRRVLEVLHGFDERLRIVGDYDFWVRAMARFDFKKVNEFLAVFRLRSGSKSLRYLADLQREDAEVRARYYGHNSFRTFAERILYAKLIWRQYNVAKLFLLSSAKSNKSKERRAWGRFLATRALQRPPLSRFCLDLVPMLRKVIIRWNPESQLGYVRVSLLKEIIKSGSRACSGLRLSEGFPP